jgi:dihydrofolate synthase/folylpolyglutamate synthase
VTQFEADTAAAFVALAAARVKAAVIEAGLGGRLDATNVIPSQVTVLTSVGLEHTEYLGETEVEIATEKLAVLRDHSTLVIGPLSPDVEEVARRTAAERSAKLVTVRDLSPTVELPTEAPYLRRNFAVALAAAEVVLGSLDARRVRGVAAGLDLHGRMEVVEGDPPLLLDAAHNPAGAEALAEALPAVAAGRPVIACLAVLADKDVAGVVGALAPVVAGVVATEIPPRRMEQAGRPGARALPASRLADLAREAGIGWVEEGAEPAAAVARARSVAHAQGGVALITGSHYLLRYAPTSVE